MISSFFSKSKPIHFVVVGTILLLVFIIIKYFAITEPLNLSLILMQTGLFLVCLMSVFVLDFLVNRNNLTQKNSYKLLMFVLFFALFPETILNSKILVSNLFVLLALRRIVSLRSKKEIKKKLFDAAFWIGIATLLYFWASLFYILIFAALILYAIADIKNWIIPLIGIITVAIIFIGYMIIADIDILKYFSGLISYSFDFTQLNSKRIVLSATLVLSYGLWALLYFIKHIKSKSKRYRPSFVLIILTALIALVIIIVSPKKNGSEFIFLFTPLAIIMTNYLEIISEKWFKEALIIVLIITPIVTLLL